MKKIVHLVKQSCNLTCMLTALTDLYVWALMSMFKKPLYNNIMVMHNFLLFIIFLDIFADCKTRTSALSKRR